MIWKDKKYVNPVILDFIVTQQKHLHQMILELFFLYHAHLDTIVPRVQKQNTNIHAQQEPLMTQEVRALLLDVAIVSLESSA